jgi:hypothetical protein
VLSGTIRLEDLPPEPEQIDLEEAIAAAEPVEEVPLTSGYIQTLDEPRPAQATGEWKGVWEKQHRARSGGEPLPPLPDRVVRWAGWFLKAGWTQREVAHLFDCKVAQLPPVGASA